MLLHALAVYECPHTAADHALAWQAKARVQQPLFRAWLDWYGGDEGMASNMPASAAGNTPKASRLSTCSCNLQ